MQATKEKLSNATNTAKENAKIYKAKVDEKVEKATARTPEEKEIAHERMKAKEAEAKMEFHSAKAQHKVKRLNAKYMHHHNPILGTAAPGTHGHGRHPGMSTTTTTGTVPTTTNHPAAPVLDHHPHKYL